MIYTRCDLHSEKNVYCVHIDEQMTVVRVVENGRDREKQNAARVSEVSERACERTRESGVR